MTGPRRPAPPPLEANDQLVTAVITAGWAIALVMLLIVYRQLPSGQRWWIWTCASGLVMGLFGLWYVPRLKRTRGGLAERRALRGQAWSSDSNTVSSTETPGRSTRS
jgi:hypothetical protein